MADDNIVEMPEGQENENAAPESPRLTNKEVKAKLSEKVNKEKHKLHMQFEREKIKNYKDPEEVDSQVIDLSQLLDPPDSFEITNLDARHPEMADGFALVSHQFWNINPQKYPRNVKDRIKMFRKLAYNQDERYRPRDLRELSDLTRDAGPRLLKPEILRMLGKLPISRHYPEFKEDADWEEQRTRPIHLPENEASRGNDGGSGGADGPGSLALEETPPNLDIIRECLERLLIQLRYRELEVVDPRKGEELSHALIDTSACSRRKRLPVRKVPLTLDNNHKVESHFVAFTQPIYPSREKGPVGNEFEPASNSKFDCIMMAGKFLDAGFTKVDIDNLRSHGGQETHAHRNFLNMVQADWKQGGRAERDGARQYFHRLFNDLAATDFRDLMYKSTLLRPQFSHTNSRITRCENDHEMTASFDKVTTSLVYSDGQYTKDDGTGVTMQEVLQSLFPQQEPPQVSEDPTQDHACTVKICEGNPNKTIIRRSMPLRIAVSLSSQVSPVEHTSNDIRVKFYNDDKEGVEDVAVYRWIGGIYADTQIENSMTHYRVYWTDSLRGGQPSETISMYDPLQADGQVIEGVFPASQNEPTPAGWWQDKFKPVLFYERVFNPDILDITLAAAILGDMKHASDSSQYILQVHDPQWNLSPPSDDQSGDQDGSNPPPANPPPTSGGPSGPSNSQNIAGYAGAAFDTALDDIYPGQDDVQMEDAVDHNEPSNPTNIYYQNIRNPGAVGAGDNLNQNSGSMPLTTQPASGNGGMFTAWSSDMSQAVPDRPRGLRATHYNNSAATTPSAPNFAPQNLGISQQGSSRFVPHQTNIGQVENLASRGLHPQFSKISSIQANKRSTQPLNRVNQTGASLTSNGSPTPALNYRDFIQTPQPSTATLQNPPESSRGQNSSGGNLEDPYYDLFEDLVPMNTPHMQQDILDTLPDYPGGPAPGGDQSQQQSQQGRK